MSQDLEKNKVLAAVLVAGIVAMLCGFAASLLVHSPEQHGDSIAIDIDTSALEAASSGNATPAGPEPILALLATADVAKGEALSKACLACHTFGQNEANKVGPNLYNIVNAKKAHRPDFAYSDAIKTMATKGETWTYQNLGRFLWKPAAYAPGTKMSFPGLKKPQDRANVISYLRTLASSPAALPSEAEIAAETPKQEEKEITDDVAKQQGDAKTKTGDPKKENADEAMAKDSDKQAAGVKNIPAQNAKTSNQALGEEKTGGKANPALQPAIGQ